MQQTIFKISQASLDQKKKFFHALYIIPAIIAAAIFFFLKQSSVDTGVIATAVIVGFVMNQGMIMVMSHLVLKQLQSMEAEINGETLIKKYGQVNQDILFHDIVRVVFISKDAKVIRIKLTTPSTVIDIFSLDDMDTLASSIRSYLPKGAVIEEKSAGKNEWYILTAFVAASVVLIRMGLARYIDTMITLGIAFIFFKYRPSANHFGIRTKWLDIVVVAFLIFKAVYDLGNL